MSNLQLYIMASLWLIVLLPLLFIRILPEKFRGAIGFGLLAIAPGIGASLAVAGCWLGILKLQAFLSEAGMMELLTSYWSHVVFIIVSGTPVAMIGAAAMILYYAHNLPPESPTGENDRS